MRLEHGERSDVGRTRSGNEDSFLIDDSIALYVVADGMGGHRAGEVASATAVSALRESMNPSQPITAAVAAANAAVYHKAGLDPELLGMGTTMTAAVLSGNQCWIGHVGDSRCYLLRDGNLTRLTQDHSFVEQLVRDGQLTPEQAAVHPKRSILTRALGIDERVDVDHYVITVQPGDRLLLCSDGLTGMVHEDGIAAILGGEADPQGAADRLVDAANANGGEDNITAVIVDVVDDGTEALPAVYLTDPPTDGPPTARVVAVPPAGYVAQDTAETDPLEAADVMRQAALDGTGDPTPVPDPVDADARAGESPVAAGGDGPFAVPEPRTDPAFSPPAALDDLAATGAASPSPVALAAPPPGAPPPGVPPSPPPAAPKRSWAVPLALVAVLAVIVVLAVILVIMSGDDDGDEQAPTPSSSIDDLTTTTASTTSGPGSTTTDADAATGAGDASDPPSATVPPNSTGDRTTETRTSTGG